MDDLFIALSIIIILLMSIFESKEDNELKIEKSKNEILWKMEQNHQEALNDTIIIWIEEETKK